jgi:hypothetical protein
MGLETVFQSNRWGIGIAGDCGVAAQCSVPNLPAGVYDVRLYFANTYGGAHSHSLVAVDGR